MRKLAAVLTLLTIACSNLSSCTASNQNHPLRIGLLNMPLSLQAWKIRDGASTIVGNQIHRGLIRTDTSNGNFIRSAAKEWEAVKNKHWLRFKIDTSMLFHDNTKLTCSAVKRSFERLVQNRQDTTIIFPSKTTFECEAEDIFVIKAPYIPAQMLDLLAAPSSAITKDDGITGLGPYKLAKSNDSEITLERFSGAGPAALVFKVADHQTLIDSFKKHEIDDLLYLGLFVNVQGQCKYIEGLSPTSFWFGINARSWGFQAKKNRIIVQRLLALGVQKSAIFASEIRSESLIPFGVMGNRTPSSKNIDQEMASYQRQLPSTPFFWTVSSHSYRVNV